MTLLEAPFISTLLGLAATFLALAVMVQIAQELYKFLSSSKSKAYTIALKDFLGPWAEEILRPGVSNDLTVRGPFQWFRLRPRGKLLPMDKETLVTALETTAPPWVIKVMNMLTLEERIQSGKPAPASATWKNLLDQLGNVEKGASGFLTASDIARFLRTWNNEPAAPSSEKGTQRGRRQSRGAKTASVPENVGVIAIQDPLDAAQLAKAFRHQFLSHVDAAADRFPLLQKNFDYAYQRRNMRHSFVIALLIALVCNLPFDRLYMKASGLSIEQASALAEQATALHQQVGKDATAVPDAEGVTRLMSAGKQALATANADAGNLGKFTYFGSTVLLDHLGKGDARATLRYLFGCLVTAFLVSFGAPVWNDIASALLRLQKGQGKKGAEDNG